MVDEAFCCFCNVRLAHQHTLRGENKEDDDEGSRTVIQLQPALAQLLQEAANRKASHASLAQYRYLRSHSNHQQIINTELNAIFDHELWSRGSAHLLGVRHTSICALDAHANQHVCSSV